MITWQMMVGEKVMKNIFVFSSGIFFLPQEAPAVFWCPDSMSVTVEACYLLLN